MKALGEQPAFKAESRNADPKRVRSSVSFRVPYWPVFASTAALAPFGIVGLALAIDYQAHLMAGASLAVVTAQLILLGTVCSIAAVRFQYLILYKLELGASQIHGRSTLRCWTLLLSEVESIVPGWSRPWWVADHNRYVVKLTSGARLFIWNGKGIGEFLDSVATAEPRLRVDDKDRDNRAERSRGRSGFTRDLQIAVQSRPVGRTSSSTQY
jgi:hypothetical protein